MIKKTTIAIDEEAREKLESLKIYPRETHSDVLNRLLKNAKIISVTKKGVEKK